MKTHKRGVRGSRLGASDRAITSRVLTGPPDNARRRERPRQTTHDSVNTWVLSTGDRIHHETRILRDHAHDMTSYSTTHGASGIDRAYTTFITHTHTHTPRAAASSLSATATASPNAAATARRLRRLPPGRACIPRDDACLRFHGLALLLALLGLLPEPLEHNVRHPRVRRSLQVRISSVMHITSRRATASSKTAELGPRSWCWCVGCVLL